MSNGNPRSWSVVADGQSACAVRCAGLSQQHGYRLASTSSMKRLISALTSAGRSSHARCPAPSISTHRAPGMRSATARLYQGSVIRVVVPVENYNGTGDLAQSVLRVVAEVGKEVVLPCVLRLLP
jgi:hypothetical protein